LAKLPPAFPSASAKPAMGEAKRKVVLGLGNLLNRDEGLGVQALKLLDTQIGEQVDVELLDGGVLGLNLLTIVEECSHLLILDAVNAGKPAGTIVELAKDQIPLYAGVKLSQHQVTFQEVLGLANIRGYLPEHLHLVGIQPDDLTVGLELSPTVEAALPEMVRRAITVLEGWRLTKLTEKRMDHAAAFQIGNDTYTMPADRHYDRETHLWAQLDPVGGQVVVGIDALGLAALGDLAYVTLPAVGTTVERGKSMGTLEAAKMTGSLIAPVSGVIVAANERTVQNPSLVNQDMYGNGWLVAIQPAAWQHESERLVSGEDLPAWVDAELERYRRQGWID